MSVVLTSLRELTEEYVKKFSDKDLGGIAKMLHQDFVLEDPVVKRVEGKYHSLKAIEKLFKNEKLSFSAKNVFVDGETSIIEFELLLGDSNLKGVDIIQWKDGKMQELRAYLDIPK